MQKSRLYSILLSIRLIRSWESTKIKLKCPMKSKKNKKEMFNPLFKNLKVEIKKKKSHSKERGQASTKSDKEAPDDRSIFLDAMSDVEPLRKKGREIIPSGQRNPNPSHPAPDDELEGLIHLHSLVRGSIEMDITFSDEYIEGAISGIHKRIVKHLKQGKIPIQDHIDLHGLTQKEAEEEVRNFLIDSHKRGLRCLLIVHGRGLNSPDSIPVLKESLPIWLNRGAARKIVLAFTSARPYDGGTGAIYVLLRKN
jgi:DNA-nicking Smr family endonuclease